MNDVAQIILQQLGGRRFIAMTGAHTFVGSDTSLSFHLPPARDGINGVRIELTPMDVYRVEFLRSRRGQPPTCVSAHEDIYCDVLRDVFTRATGLETSL